MRKIKGFLFILFQIIPLTILWGLVNLFRYYPKFTLLSMMTLFVWALIGVITWWIPCILAFIWVAAFTFGFIHYVKKAFKK